MTRRAPRAMTRGSSRGTGPAAGSGRWHAFVVHDSGRWRATGGKGGGRGLKMTEVLVQHLAVETADDGTTITFTAALR